MKIFYTALIAAVFASGAQASLLPAEETELFAFTPVSREETTTAECDSACEAAREAEKDAAEDAAEAAKEAAEKAAEDAKKQADADKEAN